MDSNDLHVNGKIHPIQQNQEEEIEQHSTHAQFPLSYIQRHGSGCVNEENKVLSNERVTKPSASSSSLTDWFLKQMGFKKDRSPIIAPSNELSIQSAPSPSLTENSSDRTTNSLSTLSSTLNPLEPNLARSTSPSFSSHFIHQTLNPLERQMKALATKAGYPKSKDTLNTALQGLHLLKEETARLTPLLQKDLQDRLDSAKSDVQNSLIRENKELHQSLSPFLQQLQRSHPSLVNCLLFCKEMRKLENNQEIECILNDLEQEMEITQNELSQLDTKIARYEDFQNHSSFSSKQKKIYQLYQEFLITKKTLLTEFASLTQQAKLEIASLSSPSNEKSLFLEDQTLSTMLTSLPSKDKQLLVSEARNSSNPFWKDRKNITTLKKVLYSRDSLDQSFSFAFFEQLYDLLGQATYHQIQKSA